MDIQLGGVWRSSPNESFSSRFLPGWRCPVQDGQEIPFMNDVKALVEENPEIESLVAEKDPLELGAELGEAAGLVLLEHVAEEPLAGGKRRGHFVSRENTLLGPDLADPVPDGVCFLSADRPGNTRHPSGQLAHSQAAGKCGHEPD